MGRKRKKTDEEIHSFDAVQPPEVKCLIHFRPKNKSQHDAYEKLERNIITFLLGPAGTGKSYLAVSYALSQLLTNKCEKIYLTRPIIEACGEKIGFLPGSLEEKAHPYMIPLIDFLSQMIGNEKLKRFVSLGKIEIAPLSFLRGRTLNGIVIVDEAQNCTKEQLKMILTRLGEESKIIITGDPEQFDIPIGKSRICEIAERLKLLENIDLHEFDEQGIVRHPLIGEILNIFKAIE